MISSNISVRESIRRRSARGAGSISSPIQSEHRCNGGHVASHGRVSGAVDLSGPTPAADRDPAPFTDQEVSRLDRAVCPTEPGDVGDGRQDRDADSGQLRGRGDRHTGEVVPSAIGEGELFGRAVEHLHDVRVLERPEHLSLSGDACLFDRISASFDDDDVAQIVRAQPGLFQHA